MSEPINSRRRLLARGALGAAAGVGALLSAGCKPRAAEPQAAAAPAPAGMPRERYEQYVEWFNQNDPRFLEQFIS